MKNTKVLTTLLTLFLTFSLAACGNPESFIEETCSEEICTEQTINAPLEQQPEESNESSEQAEEETSEESEENANQENQQPPIKEEEKETPVYSYGFPNYSSSWGLPERMYNKAINYYYANYYSISNKRYVTIIDFSKHSSQRRWFLFDLSTGQVNKYLTSHGRNSDLDNDGYATEFSNTSGSKQSSLGFYSTAETYYGSHGFSMRLDGLDSSNSRARSRAIVVHPANYVQESNNYSGRSWGCPALDPSVSAGVINKIKSGSLMLIDK